MNRRQKWLVITIAVSILSVLIPFYIYLRTVPHEQWGESYYFGSFLHSVCIPLLSVWLLYLIPLTIIKLADRQKIIIWTSGVFISIFSLIKLKFAIPILAMGALLFWAFKDIKTPLTKRFVIISTIIILGLILLALMVWSNMDYHYRDELPLY